MTMFLSGPKQALFVYQVKVLSSSMGKELGLSLSFCMSYWFYLSNASVELYFYDVYKFFL